MPFENPTPLTNFVEMLMILLIPAALTYTFGIMVGSRGQGWSLFAAMMVVLVIAIAVAVPFEQRGGEVLQQTGVELSASDDSTGGNLSDKEQRFGHHQLGALGRLDHGGLERLGRSAATTPGPAGRRWCR